MKAPYRGVWIGPECRKAASLEAIRAVAFSGSGWSGDEDQVPPGSVRWPWPPNYTFARPDDRPYQIQDVLPRFAPGWRSLIREAFEMAAGRRVVQVKEKFGRLHVYLATGENDANFVAWEQANSARSLATCAVCGAIDASVSTAATVGRGHVETLCGPCRAEREAGEADPSRVRAMWQDAARRARENEASE